MKKYILSFICDLEGYKTAIKQLHWDAKSLSQHQLCDDIATTISDYQDKVSEVEQSISGRLPINNLKGTTYKITNLKKFVEDVISGTNSFYAKLKNEGDKYIGMRSDTEAFLSDLQRQLYLVDFTVKESLKERLRNKINENRVTISDGKNKYSLTENELREFVCKAVSNVNEHYLNKDMALREFNMYLESLKEFEEKTRKVCEVLGETGYKRATSFLGALLRELNDTRKYIEAGDIRLAESKSGIHIKDSKKGTFTAAAKKHGKGVQEFANDVLKNPGKYSTAMEKKARFAHEANKWNKK